MISDRLGSVGKYFPYGEERPAATVGDAEKFAAYFRDNATGLDYAINRYYDSGTGRFLTPDRTWASGGVADPGNWNRYVYTGHDPVNFMDPAGLNRCAPDDPGCIARNVSMLIVIPIWVSGPEGDFPIMVPVVQPAFPPSSGSYSSKMASVAKELSNEVKAGDITDCEALSQFPATAADGTNSLDVFKNAFGVLVPNQANTRNVPGLAYAAGGNVSFQGSTSGFKLPFQNSDPLDITDQSHHFAAFFELGFAWGGLLGKTGAQLFEWAEALLGGSFATNQGDVNLGKFAAQLGADVASGKIKPGDVSKRISDDLCQH